MSDDFGAVGLSLIQMRLMQRSTDTRCVGRGDDHEIGIDDINEEDIWIIAITAEGFLDSIEIINDRC